MSIGHSRAKDSGLTLQGGTQFWLFFDHLTGKEAPKYTLKRGPQLKKARNWRGKKMKPSDLGSLSLDELWSLREQVDEILARRISAEKAALDRRLRQLSLPQNFKEGGSRSATLPTSVSEVYEPCRAVGDLGRTRKAATLGGSTA